jgi:hypothetical protein
VPIELIMDDSETQASILPTIKITVKNEMAPSNDESPQPDTGRTRLAAVITLSPSVYLHVDPVETATLRHIFDHAAYYLIKSGNEENVSLAKAKVICTASLSLSIDFKQLFIISRPGCLVDSLRQRAQTQSRLSSRSRT